MAEELKISVAGIRGLYSEALTPEVAYRFGVAFGIYTSKKKIFVGRDTRVSGEVLSLVFKAGLLASGKDVVDMGIAPTPMVAYAVEKNVDFTGAVVTASHNPQPYNGIKFFSPEGIFLNGKETEKFLKVYEGLKIDYSKPPGLLAAEDLSVDYFHKVMSSVDAKKIRAKRFKVVVDACQGTGALFSEKFLSALGCEVIVINAEPYGVFAHNPEPLPENLNQLARKVVKEKADIGFAQDPDADRLSIVCDGGRIPGEEMTIVLAIKNIMGKKPGSVVVNLSTTALVEEVANEYGAKVHRTRIGEVNVVEKMKKVDAVIGGEGNGGVIMPSVHYGRDSFVAMGLILEYMAETGEKISDIVGRFPEYTMIKRKFEVGPDDKVKFMKKVKERYFDKEKVVLTDGIKIIRRDGWIHIRESSTEHVVRFFVEGKSPCIARSYYSEVEELLL